MMKPLKEARKQFFDTLHNPFFKHKCAYCKNEIIFNSNDCEKFIFEPKEIEEEVYVFDILDEETEETEQIEHTSLKKELQKRTVSSDYTKDIYRYKCPCCGHINEIRQSELTDLRCAMDGEMHDIFILSEEETKAAKAFIEEHDHSKELMSEKGNPFFSTLGQQFTYMITPGGLGNMVTIKCNKCGKTKDITDTDNW